MSNLYVVKRNGSHQPISFDKILHRINALCGGLDVDAAYVSQQVVSQIYPGVKTTDLDEFSAQICAHLQTEHPDYGTLAVRIVVSNNHKETPKRFSEAMGMAYENYENYEKDGRHNPLIHPEVWRVIRENEAEINGWVNQEADFDYDYFGFQTLLRSYLLKVNGKVIERPQYMLLRVSLGLWFDNLRMARDSYEKLSGLYFTHATPTLFHAGSLRPQLLSCYLLGTEDSIDGIYKTITDCAKISKWAGGIGIHTSEIRGKGSKIKGTQGITSGIIPMLRVYNETARYVNQCFSGDTKIITPRGYREIEKIVEGDLVWTGNGTWEPVMSVMRRGVEDKDDIYELRTQLTLKPVNVTGEHEVLVLRTNGARGSVYAMRGLVKKRKVKPKMLKVSELTKDDFLGFPAEEPGDVIDESKMDSRMIYEGMVYWKAQEMGDDYVLNMNHLRGKEWLLRYLTERGCMVEQERLDESWVRLKWRRDGFMVNLDREWNEYSRYSFLRGILMISGTNMATTTDMEKLELMRYMLRMVHFGCLINEREGLYSLVIPKSRRSGDLLGEKFYKTGNKHYFYHMGYQWTPIRDVKKTEKRPTEVYDLNVRDEHTYVVGELGVVHNSGRRNGSIAIYLEPHHPDILEFLELRKNHGAEEERCRDLFTALWVSDTFLERVEYAQKHLEEEVWWPLLDPCENPDLQDLVGNAYRERIMGALESGNYVKKVLVLSIWKKMLASQIETGTPYVTNKDAVNSKSNHENIGVIRSSNLCNEIVEYSDVKEYACCCLASINLSKFYENGEVQLNKLVEVCGLIVRNLNRVIDLNFYPVPETERSNNRHRPLGVGIQGLADLFALMGIAWEDKEAKEWNALLMETISYGCWRASCEIAREREEMVKTSNWIDWAVEHQNHYGKLSNDDDLSHWVYRGEHRWTLREIRSYLSQSTQHPGAYSTFEGSPLSRGIFQHDMWGVKGSGRWDWSELRKEVQRYGVRNSLCTALMPTASTAQIMGNQECFEPFSNLLYVRRTIAGDYIILNKYLVRALLRRGLWNRELKDWMVASNGSIQEIREIPEDLRRVYKTVYEVKQKTIIECAAARAPFVDQTQSMNLFFIDPTPNVVSAAMMYGWKLGLKTLLYYLRSQPSVQAQQVTVDPSKVKKKSSFQERLKELGQVSNNGSDCEFCSS